VLKEELASMRGYPDWTPREVHYPSRVLYNALAVPMGMLGVQFAAFASAKARDGLHGRRQIWKRFEEAKPRLRGAAWFHASSVGEYEQARPIMRALRERAAAEGHSLPILLTVFSPSGYHFARRHADADHLDYLPFDTPQAAGRLVATIRPRLLSFVKFDCWPNLIWAARRAEVPLLLLDATLHRKSRRLAPVARDFFGRLFDCFTAIGAISDDDARRFREDLGTRAPVVVTGDTRTDQVVHRWRKAEDGALQKLLSKQPWRYVTLGSIWPEDEAVILRPSLERLQSDSKSGLIAVPHEPTEQHLIRLESAAESHGLRFTRLSRLIDLQTRERRPDPSLDDSRRWRLILVDTVGVLAEIYRASVLSYVGGSFSTGVHNVLEPAVTGQPVLFGPRIHNAYEAERLVARGAGFVVSNPFDARQRLEALLDDEQAHMIAAKSAQDFVLGQSGATERSVELIWPLIRATAGPA
jgi:3-deoxy-D-manno-octulosonic-acid transferase